MARLRKLVDHKDSVASISSERERERSERQRARQIEIEKRDQVRRERQQIQADLAALFAWTDAWKRGKPWRASSTGCLGATTCW